ncbi:MAG TPA: hypothetical protein VGA36_01960 [Nitriliruptorales bacterium]
MTVRDFDVTSDVNPLDTERLLRTLGDHGVEYVLIGGLAAIAHGSMLATADADLLPRLDDENLDRLLDALAALDARVLVAEDRLAMEAGEPWEVPELRRGPAGLRSAEAWHFSTDAGPVDVVLHAAGVGPYDLHRHRAEEREVFGLVVAVASREDLIASKRSLGRPKDRHVLEELDPDG